MKKLLATLLASAMALTTIGSLVACGGGDDAGKEAGLKPSEFSTAVTTVNDPLADKEDETDDAVKACTIRVWAPAEVIPTYTALIEKFKSTEYHNGKYANVEVEFEAQEEGNVKGLLGTDLKGAADVFFYAGDHTSDMIRNNYLLPLRGKTGSYYSAAITQRDDEGVVEAVTRNGYCYAFPTTNDNGYYLVYNKALLSAEEAGDLDVILAKAKENNKSFVWNYGTGFFAGTFFFGAGVEMDEKGPNSNFSAFAGAEAEIGAKATIKYINSGKCNDGNTSVVLKSAGGNNGVVQGIKDGNIIAGFCGTWESPEEADLATIGCTKLPVFTATADNTGTKYQMGGLYGGKYCGINSSTKNAAVAMAVANYLNNEDAQKARFQSRQSGPSNKVVSQLQEVKDNVPLKAYLDQVNACGVPNGDIPGTWWSAMETYTGDIETGAVTLSDLGLANLVKAMTPEKA